MNLLSASNVGLIENPTWQSNLTALFHTSLVSGDIDNDGNFDLVLIGCDDTCSNSFSKIYINNGTSLVENQTWQQNLTGVSWGSIALGDLDRNGDLDLVLTGCLNSTSSLTCDGVNVGKIYINNGTSLVENQTWQQNLTATSDSSITLGDLDNDGDLDLVTVGNPLHAKVYINNGTSLVENLIWQSELTAVDEGQVALGDVDNDGDLDLALTGDSGSDFTSFYINNGTSFAESTQWNQNFDYMDRSSLIFGDVNNDGNLDLMMCGQTSGDDCDIYKNNGSNLILNQSTVEGLPGLYRASIAFGDYDNDGDLDWVGAGKESGRARVFENNESNNYFFQNDALAHTNISDNIQRGTSIIWVDVDNDKDLDLTIVGLDFVLGVLIAKVFINNNTISNTQPNASISDFSSSYLDGVLTLGWGNGSDTETNTSGLYYNLMVGNSTTNHTIVSGVYGGSSGGGGGAGGGANGYFGNMMQRKSISLNKYLSADTYYWYVQTIDTGLAKSNWSAIQSIVISDDSYAPNLTSVSSSVTSSTATITWTTDESANSTVYYGTTTATTSSSDSDDLVTSHSISLTGLSASTLYYYNVSSCDYWANCNTSIQYSFTTSAAPPPENGGSSGSSITVTPTPEVKEFDIDFSTETSGTLEAEQGDIKTFSFNSQVTHKITLTEVTTNSVKLIIESEPIILILNIGETKQLDINTDGVDDFEIKLVSIANGVANLLLKKLEGAEILAEEELEKEALFDVKVSIVNLFEVVRPGREVIAEIEVFNVNNIGQVDVVIDYYITNKDDNQTRLVEGSDTLAVEAVASFVRSLKVPYDIKAEKYLFDVDVKYNDEIMASGSVEFRVIKNYKVIIAVGIIALIVVGIFFYLWRIKKKEEKDIGNLRKMIRKMKIKRGKRWQK